MQRWAELGITEERTRTYGLPADLRAAGVTISSIVSVGQTTHESGVPDANPDILNGSSTKNSGTITYRGQSFLANQAVLVPVKGAGGVPGGVYVVTITLSLSNGDTKFVEDCLQPVSTYVPP